MNVNLCNYKLLVYVWNLRIEDPMADLTFNCDNF